MQRTASHLIDDEGDVGKNVVEGGGALVDDTKLDLAPEEQRCDHCCRQDLN